MAALQSGRPDVALIVVTSADREMDLRRQLDAAVRSGCHIVVDLRVPALAPPMHQAIVEAHRRYRRRDRAVVVAAPGAAWRWAAEVQLERHVPVVASADDALSLLRAQRIAALPLAAV